MSGVSSPTPPQNSLMPPPVPVLSTTGVLQAGLLAELLGHGGGEREDGRRADDADLVAGLRLARRTATSAAAAAVMSRRFMVPPNAW